MTISFGSSKGINISIINFVFPFQPVILNNTDDGLVFVFKADSIFFEKYLLKKRGLCKVIEVFAIIGSSICSRNPTRVLFLVCHGIYWQYLFRQINRT
jgi:hypothetical protein